MATGTSEQHPQDQSSSDWQIGKDLGACMKELYARNLWTDVSFRCNDHDAEERIHAHKIFLAARSPVFQAMFYGAYAEAEDDVELKDAEKEILDLFLRYVYTDNVVLEEEDAASALLQMAHFYQVPSLVQLCADYLEKVTTIENVCEMLTLAEFYRIKTLKESCCNYIDQNATAVMNSGGFMDVSKECLLHILKGDTFYTAEEEILAKTAEWAGKRLNEQGLEQNSANFRKVLGELFYYLRLPTLSYQELVKCTRNKGYLSTEEFMNITDFINHIPGTSVTSNSAVARVPMIETLAFNIEDEEQTEHDHISCSIEVLVSRNVKLLEFSFRNMMPHLIGSSDICMRQGIEECHVKMDNSTSLGNFVSKYMKPCKAVSFSMCDSRGHYPSSEHRIAYEYEKIDGLNFPECQYIVAEGSLTVGSFTHNFTFNVSNKCCPTVALTQPLVLEKRDQPYICSINVRIPNYYDAFILQMKTRLTKSQDTIISKAGHVRVSASTPSFLKSVKIQTLANRS